MPAPSGGSKTASGRFQFTLGTLLVLTAATSALLAMWSWRGASGALELCLAAAVGVTAVGIWRRRVRLIAAGVLLVAAMLYAFHYSAQNTAVTSSMGFCTAALRVTVVDAVTGEPVRGAKVRVSGVSCDARAPTTGDEGTVELLLGVTYTASRYRSVLMSEETRSVNVRGLVLEVEAAGHRPVQRPLADYLGRRCDLRDSAFLPITVELERPTPKDGP